MKLWNLHLRNRRTDSPHRERGQSIAIIALALVGLLAFVGIAVDVGFLFARSTQLQAAVDSAALAGVTELVISKDAADQRAGQFLNANNIPISVTLSLDSYKDTTVIGEDEYSITVTWPVELFFLKLIGLDSYDLVRSATAAYFPQADIYASRRVDQGVVSTSNQSIFGPNICTSYGDPFSPFNSAWEPGAYTYHYRILLPPDYPDDVLRIELFDPDSINQSGDRDDVVFSAVATGINPTLFPPGTHEKLCQGGDGNQKQPCLIPTGEESLVSTTSGITIDQINPFWLVRIDENRGSSTPGVCDEPSSYNINYNTHTLYELFYYRRNDDGTIEPISLASYTGQKGNEAVSHDTDLRWVSPGGKNSFDQPVSVPVDAGSEKTFELNIANDLPNILEDPGTGNRFVYLDITSIDGASENGFEVWAGPDDYVNTVPSNANDRNLFVINNPGTHYSRGATVYGMGRLPMNSNTDNTVDIPLMYVGPDLVGQSIFISTFDLDAAAKPPIVFYFDSIAFTPDNSTDNVNWQYTDWAISYGGGTDPDGRCFDGGNSYNGECNNKWVDPRYEIIVPGDPENCFTHPTRGTQCIPFYGGRLIARYNAGNHDTYGWQINVTGLPYLVR
ncbi:MAG: Tad domain-containing protein [Anaerolineales bacterium]|nr:Tad domain-containing protein [Anaerolineales bacterium]